LFHLSCVVTAGIDQLTLFHLFCKQKIQGMCVVSNIGDFWLTQQWCWRFQSSGMLHRIMP